MSKSETAKKVTQLVNALDQLVTHIKRDVRDAVEAAKALKELKTDEDDAREK